MQITSSPTIGTFAGAEILSLNICTSAKVTLKVAPIGPFANMRRLDIKLNILTITELV